MADPRSAPVPAPAARTAFQLHAANLPSNVVDLTERKLVACANAAGDPQQRTVLMALVDDYRAGRVSVAWRRGCPIPRKVVREP